MGENDSDVYVYMTTAGLTCCGARPCTSTAAMVDHLRAHVIEGDCVPEHVIPALLADDEANFPPSRQLAAIQELHAEPTTETT